MVSLVNLRGSWKILNSNITVQKRLLNCISDAPERAGLILGVYNEDNDMYGIEKTFTKTAKDVDKRLNGKLAEVLKLSGPVPKKGEFRIFYGLVKNFPATIVVGIGDSCQQYVEVEQIDERKESIRMAAGTAVRALQDVHVRTLFTESFGHAESAAEGTALGVWIYQELKHESKQVFIPRLELYDDCDFTGWQIGLQKAAAQNLARQLCETPSNLLTPISFSQSAVEILSKAGVNIEVKIRNWAKMVGMDGFLAASKGSCEPPVWLEVSYFGCDSDTQPIVLIGKGVTFNSGGLCLKSCRELKPMRGDLAGAANIIGVCRATSALQLPVNIRAIMPLYENLPGTCAMKPGDIVKIKNGKTVLVEDTDYAGRLALADALSYAVVYNPKFVLDVGTHCPEIDEMLGSSATGVYSNNDQLYEMMRIASIHTGDRIWRMPLWAHYTRKVIGYPKTDVRNEFKSTGAPCTCAAFLKEFIPPTDWIHLETHGVNLSDGKTFPYLRQGMSGRPTRTIIEFIAQLACKHTSNETEPS